MPPLQIPTAAQVAGGALLTSDFTGRIRTLAQGVEGLFDHFNNYYSNAAGSNRSHQDYGNAAANTVAHGKDWHFVSDTGVTPITRSGLKPHASVARITVTATAGDYGFAMSKCALQPDAVGLPITFEGRFRKVTTNDRGFWIGLRECTAATLNESPALFTTGATRRGICLVYGSATQMRFRNVGAGATDGALANYPTLNTWFTVKIILNSNVNAVCTVVDSTGTTILTETFTTDITQTIPLAASYALGITTASAASLDSDWLSLSCEGVSLAP